MSAPETGAPSDAAHWDDAGFSQDGAYCWSFAHSELSVWQEQRSGMLKCHLPYLLPDKPFVSLCSFKGVVAAVLVSKEGNISFWPNFAQPESMISERVAGSICALAAGSCRSGIFAATGCGDGSVHILTYAGTLGSRKLGFERIQGDLFNRFSERTAAGRGVLVEPAIALKMKASDVDSDCVELFILSSRGVSQWKLKARSEELLWAVSLEDIAGADKASAQLLDLSLPPAVQGVPRWGSCVVLYSVHSDHSKAPQACASVVAAPTQGSGAVRSRAILEGVSAGSSLQLSTNATMDVFLVWSREQPPIAWTRQGGAKPCLKTACWAAAASEDSRSWKMLQSDSQVMVLPIRPTGWRGERHKQAARAQSAEPSEDGAAVLAKEGVASLLEQALAAGQAGQDLNARLESLGAYRSGNGANSAVAAFSSRLANALPKHWGGSGTISEQLSLKQNRHNLLLQILSQAGALCKLGPSDLRTLLENGEKIAAVSAIREIENALQARQDPAGLHSIQTTIGLAGRAVAVQASVQSREDWELFYSKPAEAAEGFFRSMPETLNPHRTSFPILQGLAQAALSALAGAGQQHVWQTQWFAAEVEQARKAGGPPWVADSPVRAPLLQLSQALCGVLPTLHSESPDMLKDACSLLLQLATPVLNAFAAAQTVLGTSKALESEYAAARSELLQPLLRYALIWCNEGDEDGDALLQSIETTAEAHRGYEELFDIAEFKEDPEHLYDRMRDLSLLPGARQHGAPGSDTLAAYVFSRLRREERFGELLLLPQDFNEELYTWIKTQGHDEDILRLRWLHEVRIEAFEAASATLQKVSTLEASDGALEAVERLTCLSKLATLASQKPGQQALPPQARAFIESSDLRLVLVEAQRTLGLSEHGLMSAQALLQAAVERRGAAVIAFDILSAAGSKFRQRNRDLWTVALQHLVTEFDWQEIHRQSREVSDEEFLQLLNTTAICRVAAACYGSGTGTLCSDDRFEEDLSAEEAVAVLEDAAQAHCAAAAPDIRAAFKLGMEFE